MDCCGFVTTTNFHWCLGAVLFLLLGSRTDELQLQLFQSLCSVEISVMLPLKVIACNIFVHFSGELELQR